jgi:hypothetical protein
MLLLGKPRNRPVLRPAEPQVNSATEFGNAPSALRLIGRTPLRRRRLEWRRSLGRRRSPRRRCSAPEPLAEFSDSGAGNDTDVISKSRAERSGGDQSTIQTELARPAVALQQIAHLAGQPFVHPNPSRSLASRQHGNDVCIFRAQLHGIDAKARALNAE